VKNGTVPAGSVLVVESFDRISRQGIDEGYDLIKSILKAGVRIVTLAPEREFDRDATKSLSARVRSKSNSSWNARPKSRKRSPSASAPRGARRSRTPGPRC
jgi:DNA invertase Pin-like site-specific DNA recombinase